MNNLTGNIVTPEVAGYGTIAWRDGKITAIALEGGVNAGANWIVPGFIDLHFHGLGDGDSNPENIERMTAFAPRVGMTTMVPALASDTPERLKLFVRKVRELVQSSKPGEVRVAGSHLEGPFLEFIHRGGMADELIRNPDVEETKALLDEAGGTLRVMTIAPELPHAGEVIALLTAAGVQVSAGHTGMTQKDFLPAVEAGVRQICHLYDAWDGREVVHGVPVPAVTDWALIEDRLMLEVIADGIHVPPELVKMAIRAAGVERIVAITDAMRGTGLPDAVYSMTDGRQYTLTNGDVGRLLEAPEMIVGSCLTMNRAFFNLIHKFERTPVEAAKMTSHNAAKCLKIDRETGALKVGLDADIAVLAPDQCTVLKTVARGVLAYEV